MRTYGMTETCGGVVYDGVPLDGVELKIDTDGRVCIRAPMVMTGYRRLDALTGETLVEGWLRTSDRGVLGDDGTLTVLGRVDDTIVTGGEKVSPDEVEQILRLHPQVLDVRVEARPDPEWGERVVAFVMPVDHSAPPQLAELRDLVSQRAERYKAPRELVIVRSLAEPARDS